MAYPPQPPRRPPPPMRRPSVPPPTPRPRPLPGTPSYPLSTPPTSWGETVVHRPNEPRPPSWPPQPGLPPRPPRRPPPRRFRPGLGCTLIPALLFLVVACLAVVLLAPGRTNVLLLGVDYTRGESFAGRTDTLILATIQPQRPYVGLLSIPRDLWVDIPGFGQNRINTAHFFAESAIPGSGATAAMATVEANFGVSVDRYVRIRFDGFREVVDALGGVDIELTEAQAGYEAGTHHLTGNKALAFVRSRIGSDDFFRMARGQMMLRAILKDLARPKNWVRLPAVLAAVNGAIDTNLSPLQLARLGFTALRLGPSKIDSRTLDRTMALGYVTSDGADVLLPQWEAINPLLKEMFGQ